MSVNIESIFSGGFVPAPLMEEIRQDPESAFLSVLNEFGLQVEYLEPGVMKRVKTAEDRQGEKSGWYIYYPDGIPSGAYGDWRKQDFNLTWCHKAQHEMSPAEWMENKRRMEQAKRERQAKQDEENRQAAVKAVSIVEDSQDAVNHPYLDRKKVKSHGLKTKDGKLIIPAINEHGDITTIQTIDAEGAKLFLKGGKKSGSFFWIEGSRQTIYICEGYATGATIHEVTGCAVVVCFDAGNVPKIAPIIREKFISAQIIIAADNDQFKENMNAGVKCAKQAAELIHASVAIPQFSSLDGKPTDFNDLFVREGIDVVRAQLTGSKKIDTPKKKFELVRADSLEISEIKYVVKGYLEEDSFNLIFGEPGCGKSFVSIGIACCVATGTPWHGHEVEKGLVVYIAGEGHNGLARRFKAWEIANGVSLKGAPIYKSQRASQLYDLAAAMDVAEAVNAVADAEGQPVRMVIIDTVARNMGGDENSTQDMNQFIEHIDALLRHPHKAAVVLVHHSSKASPGQARGSTALRGALDAEYQVEMDGASKMIKLENRKMKDGEIPSPKQFNIKKVGLGVFSNDGEEVTGAVLETVDISGLIEQVKEKSATLTKNQNIAFNTLVSLIKTRELADVFVDVTTDDWRDACHENHLERNRFREAKDALVAKNIVSISPIGIVCLIKE